MKGINPQLMERLSQRLFFVVNKADVKHVCEGAPESSLLTPIFTLVQMRSAWLPSRHVTNRIDNA